MKGMEKRQARSDYGRQGEQETRNVAGKGSERHGKTDRQRVNGRHREWVWHLRGQYMCHTYIFKVATAGAGGGG